MNKQNIKVILTQYMIYRVNQGSFYRNAHEFLFPFYLSF